MMCRIIGLPFEGKQMSLIFVVVYFRVAGLECLFDSIDDALQLDQTIDLGLEDDEWSAPASSIDGTLGLLCET